MNPSSKMAQTENDKKNSKGCCFWFFYILKVVPVLFILTIVMWSYYAYVIELCAFTINSNVKRVIYLLLYHFIIVFFFWSYWKTIFTSSGRIPAMFKLTESQYDLLMHAEDKIMQQGILQNYSKDLPNTNFTVGGGVRYCDKCKNIKPDRTHHCSVCSQCILKMDHHCPWVNNCISFTNYKYFILFLAYGVIYCLFVTMTTLEYFILFWKGHLGGTAKFHILFLFFVALMFSISLLSLFGYHCHLLRYNRTTLEGFRPSIFQSGPDANGYNLGAYANFKQVFGDDPKSWLLPIYTSLGDGVIYPVQSRHQPSSYHSMDSRLE